MYETGPLRDVTGATIRPGGLALTDRALEVCAFTIGAQLLDVGCGAGASVEHLRSRYGYDAHGVDISPTLITEGLSRNPTMRLEVAAAEALPFVAGSFDGILCECVLSLVEVPLKALVEFVRVLRSSGWLILSDLFVKTETEPRDYPRGAVARDQIESWLFQSGFTIVMWEDHSILLKELAARLILAGCSLDGLCCGTSGSGQRPGYYLIVARRA
ncbi:MAG TPA: class I SAM-dependent methyltransferase [Desulfuromonadales bacterium]|nr:class I SAM-dependent methyltransferase [Desulfuromonadales bacterium]